MNKMKSFNYEQNHNADPRPIPEGGAALYFYTFYTHLGNFFLLNLLTLLCSLPVLTIPAAICAMNRVCGQLIRKGYCFLAKTYFEEFRQSLFRSLALGSLYTAFGVSGFICICYGIAYEGSGIGAVSRIFGFVEIGISFLLSGWSFLLLSLQDLPARKVLSNTLAMLLLEPKCSLKILMITAVAAGLLWVLFPFSLILLLSLPVLTQYTLCWITRDAIQKRIINRAADSE